MEHGAEGICKISRSEEDITAELWVEPLETGKCIQSAVAAEISLGWEGFSVSREKYFNEKKKQVNFRQLKGV